MRTLPCHLRGAAGDELPAARGVSTVHGAGEPDHLGAESQPVQLFEPHRGEVREGHSTGGDRKGAGASEGVRANLAPATREAQPLGGIGPKGHKAPRALVAAAEIGGSKPAPSRVTSKASTTTKASPEEVFAVPVTSITSVWLPAPSRGLVYTTVEVAGRVGAKVSTVATRASSIQTLATPQTSHGTPIQRTPVQASLGASVPAVSSERARVRVGTGPFATVTVTVADVVMFPAASRARAARRWVPSGTVRVSHATS